MTSTPDFDRDLTSWLDERAPSRAPEDILAGALARTSKVSPRPSWLVPERWTFVQTSLRLARGVPKPTRVALVVAAVLVALVAALVLVGAGAKLFAPRRPIAFDSWRDGHRNIYLMDANGSDVIQLTNGSDNSVGAWSPDGSRLLFSSNRDGNDEIYVMNADGSNLLRLTNDPHNDSGAVWSPDGKRIAFGRPGTISSRST